MESSLESPDGAPRRSQAEDEDTGWNIAELPDMYDMEQVREPRISSATLRRQSLGAAEHVIEAAEEKAIDSAHVWSLDELLESTEKEHQRFSPKDVAVEVESVMVDHLEFDFEF